MIFPWGDFAYRQPPLASGSADVRLVLYIEPVGELLYAIYRRIYRIRFPLPVAAFRRMLRDLEGRSVVGALRTSRREES